MSESAHVTSLDALRAFHASACTFREDAREALTTVEMAIRRTQDFLDDQEKHWLKEIRRWDEALVQAKTALRRRKLFHPGDNEPDCSEEEKAVRSAALRLEEAQVKLETTRRWQPRLKRAIEEYEGPGRTLQTTVEAGLPRALALLERQVAALESYLKVTASRER